MVGGVQGINNKALGLCLFALHCDNTNITFLYFPKFFLSTKTTGPPYYPSKHITPTDCIYKNYTGQRL